MLTLFKVHVTGSHGQAVDIGDRQSIGASTGFIGDAGEQGRR
jgi:hypothetical protein